jgi:hypothetical protein
MLGKKTNVKRTVTNQTQRNYIHNHDDERSMDHSTSVLSVEGRDNGVAVEETDGVHRSKALVCFVLLIAIAGALSVYIYNDRMEENNFKQNFQANAYKVRNNFLPYLDTTETKIPHFLLKINSCRDYYFFVTCFFSYLVARVHW